MTNYDEVYFAQQQENYKTIAIIATRIMTSEKVSKQYEMKQTNQTFVKLPM